LYIAGSIDDDPAFAAGEVEAIAFWLVSVLTPGFDVPGWRATEMSDLGFTGGLDFTVRPGFTAGGSDFRASTGCCWGAFFPVSTCLAAGLALGIGFDFVGDFVLGGLAFLAVWE
jgi:hypothetical protein